MTKPTLPASAWIVVIGDSRLDLSGDVGPGPTGTIISQLQAISPYFAPTQVYSFAHDGFTTDDMLVAFNQHQLIINPAAAPVYCFIWGGVNDFGAGKTPGYVYENLQSLWNNARALGYIVVAFTTGMVGGTFADQLALDELIMAAPELYDVLIRPEAVIPIKPTYDTNHTWYVDQVHPNTLGNTLLAYEIDKRCAP